MAISLVKKSIEDKMIEKKILIIDIFPEELKRIRKDRNALDDKVELL